MRPTATNENPLGQFLGDPTRWGSTVTWSVPIVGGADTGYNVGPDAVMMQFSDLRARTVDLICEYSMTGVLALDGPFAPTADGYTGFGLRWNLGGGQSAMQIDSAASYGPALGAANAQWVRHIGNNHIVRGVMQNQIPVPLTSLVVRPVFRLENSNEPDHVITIQATIIVAPRA